MTGLKMSSSVILAYALPQPRIIGDSIICPNSNTTLQVTENFPFYFWDQKLGGKTLIAPHGFHTLMVEDNLGCRGMSSFLVKERLPIAIHLSGDTTICAQDTALLHIRADNYQGLIQLGMSHNQEPATLIHWENSKIKVAPLIHSTYELRTAMIDTYPCPIELKGKVQIQVNKIESQISLANAGIKCFGGNDGSLQIKAKGLFKGLKYHWSTGENKDLIQNLRSGMYRVTISDEKACTHRDSFFLKQPEQLKPKLWINPQRCADVDNASVEVSMPTGGTPPYLAFFNDTLSMAIPKTINHLKAGQYSLLFLDKNRCAADTNFQLIKPTPLVLQLGQMLTLELGDSLMLLPQSNFQALRWRWGTQNTSALLDSSWNASIRPQKSDWLKLEAWDEYNCYTSATLNVVVDQNLAIYAPNVFSPNEDQVNDRFNLFSKPGLVRNIDLLIVKDRWGNIVYQGKDLAPNEKTQGWDGKVKGQLAQAGVYLYMVELSLFDGRKEQLTGGVTVLR